MEEGQLCAILEFFTGEQLADISLGILYNRTHRRRHPLYIHV